VFGAGKHEEISNCGEDANETLQRAWRAKPLHQPLPFPQRQMRVFGLVVQSLVRSMLDGGHDLPPCSAVWRHCEQHYVRGRTATVKIGFSDFQVITRSRTAPSNFHVISSMLVAASTLLEGVYPFQKPVRLLGITLSSLGQDDGVEQGQLELRL
jgi:nucleotidyltransferase/DNA polymerase involved in DNA repair